MSTTAPTGSRTSAAKGLESAIDDITAFGAAAARDAKTAARDAKAGIFKMAEILDDRQGLIAG